MTTGQLAGLPRRGPVPDRKVTCATGRTDSSGRFLGTVASTGQKVLARLSAVGRPSGSKRLLYRDVAQILLHRGTVGIG